jgi:hypothetical protein
MAGNLVRKFRSKNHTGRQAGQILYVPVFDRPYEAVGYQIHVNRLGEQSQVACNAFGAPLDVRALPVPVHIWNGGQFECSVSGLYIHKFNLRTLRFMEVYLAGFIDGQDTDENTPAITIGRCTKL